MGYENVKLWFAKDQDGEIITIDEVGDVHNTYICPVCGSSLLPKATESFKVTPHFAHVDASKCNSESHVHWWLKNKLIEPGDEFKVVSDEERKYICKEILVEQPSPTSFGEYRPDVTVITENGETIYFEMAFSNKKKVKDYLDIWLELNNIVVEVNISKFLKTNEQDLKFKALFHEGKAWNINKQDVYHQTIGVLKERAIELGIKDKVKRLDWFWDDLTRYKNGLISEEDVYFSIDALESEDLETAKKILNKSKCTISWEDYVTYKTEIMLTNIKDTISKYTNSSVYMFTIFHNKKNKIVEDAEISCASKVGFLSGERFNIFKSYDFDFIFRAKLKNIDAIIENNNEIELAADEKIKLLENYLVLEKLDEMFYITKKYKYNSAHKKSVFIEFNYIGRCAKASFNFKYSAKNSVEYMTGKIQHRLDQIQEKVRKLESWDYANNNITLKSAIFNLGTEYRKINENYKFYLNKYLDTLSDKYIYLPKVDVYYSHEGCIGSFILEDTIIYSDEYNEVYGYLDTEIKKILTGEHSLLYRDKILANVIDLIAIYDGTSLNINYNKNRKQVKIEFCYNYSDRKEVIIDKNFHSFVEVASHNILKQEMVDYVKENHTDTCRECGLELKLSDGEILFFLEKDLNLPKRCKNCRKNSKGVRK